MDSEREPMKAGGDVIPKGKLTFWLLLATVVTTGCGSFQFGYQIGVLTGPSITIQEFYNETNIDRNGQELSETAELWLWSTTVSVFCIGGALGGFSGGYLSDALGRKGAMLLINCLSIVSGLLMGLSYIANSYEMIIIGRLIIGIYAGMSATLVPLYLAEISPSNLRGAIGTCHQLNITIGILVAQILGLFAFTGEDQWPILLALTAIPSILQLITLPFCPESPRWLYIKKNKEKKAEEVLKRLRGTDDVKAEIREIAREAEEDENTEKAGIFDVLTCRDPSWKKPLIICVALHLGQQFSGINAVMFYATEIYYQTGMEETQVAYATIGTGATNVLMTFVAVFVVESAGRRNLLLYPFGTMVLATGLLPMSLVLQESADGWKWMSLILIYLYIVAFAIGPGPIPYVMVPELWAQGPRPAAMSISVQVNWLTNFIVGLTFPYLQASIGAYAFLFFMSFCFLTTIFTWFYVPETKGRSFEEIVASFQPGDRRDDELKNPVYTEEGKL